MEWGVGSLLNKEGKEENPINLSGKKVGYKEKDRVFYFVSM